MGEGAELDKKKREFHDVSIQLTRLIDSGNVEDAQKLYNLYSNMYYEILPSLKEEEVSQYYQNLNQIYNKLKPYLVTREEVSEDVRTYKTDIDTLYELIQEKGEINLKEVQEKFKIDRKSADEWATILEKGGLISIKYSLFKGVLLRKLK